MQKSIYSGIAGFAGILALYLLLLLLSNGSDFDSLVNQIREVWYWILPLAIGFGIQVGLYSFIKLRTEVSKALTGELARSGTVSTGAMVACCAHNLTGLFALLGISGVAVFFAEYQIPLFVIGLSSNLFGIAMMLASLQRVGFSFRERAVGRIVFALSWAKVRWAVLLLGIVFSSASFAFAGTAHAPVSGATENTPEETSQSGSEDRVNNSWKVVIDDQGNVSVTVQPLQMDPGKPARFIIGLSTHSVDLTYRMVEVLDLVTDGGTSISLESVDGDAPGGHHRQIEVEFSTIPADTTSLTLKFSEIDGIDRLFTWNISGSAEME